MSDEVKPSLGERFRNCVAALSQRHGQGDCPQHGDFARCSACFDDRRREAVARERRSIRFMNACEKRLLVRRLDGCVYAGSDHRRCDYIAVEDTEAACWLIEFKGASYADACAQLCATYEQLRSDCDLWRHVRRIVFVAVLSSGKSVTRATDTSSSVRKLDGLVRQLRQRGVVAEVLRQEREVRIQLCG